MALYVTREGSIGASLDTYVNLTTYAGQTVNAITVPSGYTAIKELYVNAGPMGAATDNQGCVFSVRLQGSGLKYGPCDFIVAGWSYLALSNDGDGKLTWATRIPVDIALNPVGDIWVKAAQMGAAEVGSPEAAVTLVFTKTGAGVHYYMTRDMNIAGVNNTVYPMTHSTDDTAAGRFKVPSGCSKIDLITAAVGGIVADATGGTFAIKLRGNGLRDGDMVIPAGGLSMQGTTNGVHGGLMPAVVIQTDLPVVAGNEIIVEAVFAGTDVTTPDIGVGVGFT